MWHNAITNEANTHENSTKGRVNLDWGDNLISNQEGVRLNDPFNYEAVNRTSFKPDWVTTIQKSGRPLSINTHIRNFFSFSQI